MPKMRHKGRRQTERRKSGTCDISQRIPFIVHYSPFHDRGQQIPWIPQLKTPDIVDCGRRQNAKGSRYRDAHRAREQLGPDGGIAILCPTTEVRLVRDNICLKIFR